MILADTSVWVDHLRAGDAELARRLERGGVLCHPFVVAEIALGTLARRGRVLELLDDLPGVPVAAADEVRALVEARRLHGRGIGFVDASLLAGCLLAPGATLWTRDKRLRGVAAELGIDAGLR